MMKQITIFDIIEPAKPVEPRIVPYGYVKDQRIVGRDIDFQELKHLIGKQVIKVDSTESNQYFKVYKVIKYFEDCDTYYKRVRPLPKNDIGYGEIVNSFIHDVVGIKECMACYEPAFTCDRVALSGNGRDQADSWISEAYCSNGRFEPLMYFPTDTLTSFCEIK